MVPVATCGGGYCGCGGDFGGGYRRFVREAAWFTLGGVVGAGAG
jgi:hypothetical protein